MCTWAPNAAACATMLFCLQGQDHAGSVEYVLVPVSLSTEGCGVGSVRVFARVRDGRRIQITLPLLERKQ